MANNSGQNSLDHYVPQLLLRGFSSGKRHFLYVFDKRTGTSFRSSVHNAGSEHSFYEPAADATMDVDEWMKTAEAEAGAVIGEIRRRGNLKHLSAGDREWLAAFAAIQMVRTKRQLTFQDDLAQTIASALRDRGVDPEQIPGFVDFDQNQLRVEFLDGIPSLSRKIFPHLSDKSIVLFKSARAKPYWISDHPVVRHNTLDSGDEIRGTLGVASAGVEIYLPISSEMVLGFLCTTIEDYFRRARSLLSVVPVPAMLNEILSAISTGEPMRAEPMNVTFFNSLQVSQSERYIFAEDNNFGLAEQMLRDDPRFKQGPKPHVVGGH